MTEFTLDKPEDIHKLFKRYRKSSSYKFRGHSNLNWKLIPKAGRSQYSKVRDTEVFRNWKRRSLAYLTNLNLSDWDYLAIAQHTGLPTRLLDWTHNPLVAAFFAANENNTLDGIVYAVKVTAFITNDFKTPFEMPANKIAFYQPSASSQRVASQLGYFSLHNKPSLELNEDTFITNSFERIIIPKEIKKELVFHLNHYGVNYLSLFPDLEGLSKHLCWFSENYEYWDGTTEDK